MKENKQPRHKINFLRDESEPRSFSVRGGNTRIVLRLSRIMVISLFVDVFTFDLSVLEIEREREKEIEK